MRKVILYGELAEKYGREFEMHVTSVRQALNLLAANFKDFKQHLIDSDTRLAGYEVWDGKYDLEGTADEFTKQGTGDIKIIPVIKGASANARIVLGVVMVIVGAILWSTPVGAPMVMTGIGMIAGGIAEKLAPKPKVPEEKDAGSSTSYIFSGQVNTSRQGAPVAIGYGTFLVGSSVISASITSSDIAV